jgi:hypothetical protein
MCALVGSRGRAPRDGIHCTHAKTTDRRDMALNTTAQAENVRMFESANHETRGHFRPESDCATFTRDASGSAPSVVAESRLFWICMPDDKRVVDSRAVGRQTNARTNLAQGLGPADEAHHGRF